MKTFRWMALSFLIALACSTVNANALDFDQEMTAIIRAYDSASFDSPSDDARAKAYEGVVKRAADLAKQYPSRGEPLVWQGQAQASQSALERSRFYLLILVLFLYRYMCLFRL